MAPTCQVLDKIKFIRAEVPNLLMGPGPSPLGDGAPSESLSHGIVKEARKISRSVMSYCQAARGEQGSGTAED